MIRHFICLIKKILKTKGSDMMADTQENTRDEGFNILHILGRLIASAVILIITQAVTPGFQINSIWSLLIAAVVLSILDYAVTRVLNIDATPFGRGITGFIAAAVIIYVIKFIVPGYNITMLGAIIGALIYGIIDMIIPGRSSLGKSSV